MPRAPRSLRIPACLLAVAALAACNQSALGKEEKTDDRAQLVHAVAASLQMVQREIRTTGFLESEFAGAITSMVSGKVATMTGEEGARVEAGQVLATLDDREAQAAFDQLKALLDTRKLDRKLAELEVEAAGRRVAQAGLDRERAKAELERQQQMDKEFVAPKALQDADLSYRGADEAFKVAEFLERKAQLEITKLDTTLAEMDARLREMQVRLDHHTIRAPFRGAITRRHVSVGATVGTGVSLFDIVDPDHLVSYLDRPQSELDLLRNAREVLFVADALPGREFRAMVENVSPIVDRETGHFRVRIRVRQEDAGTLVHGMFVRARIQCGSQREALMVPKIAVVSEGDIAVVMVARDGKAIRVDLDPGLELQDLVECRNVGAAGLRPGDLVITSGQDELKDQARVEVAQ